MPVTAPTTTFQVGTYNALNDSFFEVLDLNDFNTFWIEWNTLRLPQPEKVYVRSFNIRTPGEPVFRYQYKNRHIQVSVRLKNTSTTTILASIRKLIAAIENPPYCLRIQLPNGGDYSYADVVAVKHNIPADPQALLALIVPSIQIDFECKPGFRGDRIYLQNMVYNPGFEAPGGSTQVVFNDPFANVDAYTVVAGSAPTVAANVMTIVSGTQVSFGSVAWGAINLWSIRFKWVTSLTASFFIHYVSANDYVAVVVDGVNLKLNQNKAGTLTTLQTIACALTTGNFYWMQVTQYPYLSTSAPYINPTIYNDSAGAVGSSVATVVGPMTPGAIATVGIPQILASGASLAVGGAFSNVHTVALFGPGGWVFVGTQAGSTGQCSGAWDGATSAIGQSGNGAARTFSGGPVASFGCARIDTAPTGGTVSATWQGYNGATPAGGATGIPVANLTDTFGVSAWVRSTNLGVNAILRLQMSEWNSAGGFLITHAVATLGGNQTNWVQLSGTYTPTQPTCAYLAVGLIVTDTTGGSLGATAWFDNVQCWDINTTNETNMAYHELAFSQSPAQLMVSGVLGDMPAPAIVRIGGYFSALGTNHIAVVYLGRRAQASSTIKLVAPTTGGSNTLDIGSYGGYHLAANLGPMYISGQAENGIFHLLGRAQTASGSPTGIWIASQMYLYQVANAQVYANAQGPQVNQFSAANVWNTIDAGQIILPVAPFSALGDPTQVATYLSTQSGTPAGVGGSALTVNWLALLPVDGELFLAQLDNLTGDAALSTSWVFVYWDGTTPTTTYSIESNALPNIAHSVANPVNNILGATTAILGLNPNADTNPQVDPTTGTSAASGVNQYLLHISDDIGDVVPVTCDIIYSPLYLFPR